MRSHQMFGEDTLPTCRMFDSKLQGKRRRLSGRARRSASTRKRSAKMIWVSLCYQHIMVCEPKDIEQPPASVRSLCAGGHTAPSSLPSSSKVVLFGTEAEKLSEEDAAAQQAKRASPLGDRSFYFENRAILVPTSAETIQEPLCS